MKLGQFNQAVVNSLQRLFMEKWLKPFVRIIVGCKAQYAYDVKREFHIKDSDEVATWILMGKH